MPKYVLNPETLLYEEKKDPRFLKPLRLSVGVTGNLGGLDNRADPDKLTDEFITHRDNSIRANLSANWLLSKSWITNVELNASVMYSDKLQRQNSIYHSAVLAYRYEGSAKSPDI